MSFRDLRKDHRNRRYRLVPQFQVYDGNEPHLRPYVTFVSPPNTANSVFTTDAEGFRVSASPQGRVDAERWLEHGGGGLVLGGSFVFGVGATEDSATIPSRLAFLSGTPQLNLGIHAGNSLQELIAAIPFLEAATSVIVCSGINNVFAALQSLGHNELYGPLFYEGVLAGLGAGPLADLAPDDGRPATGAEPARVLPSATTEGELADRLEAALRRQLRDLSVLAGAVGDGARLLFCLQPFADPALREPIREERELFELHQERQQAWTRARDFVASNWDSYARRVAAGCDRLGVPFADLPARGFTGWSFYDRVHMTDDGYRQAASMIWEALCSAD